MLQCVGLLPLVANAFSALDALISSTYFRKSLQVRFLNRILSLVARRRPRAATGLVSPFVPQTRELLAKLRDRFWPVASAALLVANPVATLSEDPSRKVLRPSDPRIKSGNTLGPGGVLQIVMLGLHNDYKLLYGPWIAMIFHKCRSD